MKSFGIWYRKNSEYRGISEETYVSDLHINLWDMKEKKGGNSNPFLDIGFNIKGFRKFKEIYVQIPFRVEEGNILDLTPKLKASTVANLVFNDDCTYKENANVAALKVGEEDENARLLYPLLTEAEIDNSKEDITTIKMNLKEIGSDPDTEDYPDLYIRFRIQSEKIKEELFCNIKKKNWFLESGFVRTQIIDIKVNKQRNMNRDCLREMKRKGFELLSFQKIHLLVIEPANSDVDILGEDFLECRKLEEEWKNYLHGEKLVEDMLAYHWKVSTKKEKPLKEYGKTVKVTSASTSWKIILIYIAVVILIGIVTNAIFTMISHLF